MRRLASFHVPRRMVLLLALLAVLSTSMTLLTPREAEACETRSTTFVYWFDAAKTDWAGQCFYCSNGYSSCFGTYPTPYFDHYHDPCSGC